MFSRVLGFVAGREQVAIESVGSGALRSVVLVELLGAQAVTIFNHMHLERQGPNKAAKDRHDEHAAGGPGCDDLQPDAPSATRAQKGCQGSSQGAGRWRPWL